MTMGVAYFVRIIVLRKIGFEATGLYQSAWTLGGLYVGFILQAMGADFYPRLTASIQQPRRMQSPRERADAGRALVSWPGRDRYPHLCSAGHSLLYSAKFGDAVGVLRWICLGATLQVITWPMGFIIVAKGKQKHLLPERTGLDHRRRRSCVGLRRSILA